MSIQKKVVIALLGVGFIILAAGLSATYYEVRNVITEGRGEDFAIIAKKTAEKIDAILEDEITTFRYLAENPTFIKGVMENRREAIEPYLTYFLSYVEEKREHVDLLVVNGKGKVLATGNLPLLYSSDQSGEMWWKMTYSDGSGKVYISNIYLDRLTGGRVLDVGIPVLDPATGRAVGAIRSVINADVFFSFIKEMNFGRTGHSMLVDSGGTPLVCTLLPLSEHFMNRPLINLITLRGNSWAIAEDDAHGGKGSVVGFSPVEYINSLGPENLSGHKWYTFVSQDPRETFSPLNRLILKAFLFDTAIVLIISLLGFFVVRRLLIRPVGLIHEGVERIRKGDLDYRIDIQSRDELQALAEGFNQMVDALKESYHNLEEKIKERTTELEKTKNYLESILRYSTDMIITADPGGRIVTFNEGAERMLGYKREEVAGTFMDDYYYHKEERGDLLEMIRRGEMVTNYETQLVRKDGKIIDISLSLSLLRDEKGRVIGTVGISKNITEMKAAQRQLKEYSQNLESMVEKRTLELEESKSHLEAMLSGIADGIVFVDQDNRITFVNDAAEEIFDLKREEWLGKDFEKAHSVEAHKKALTLIKDMKEGRIKSYASEIKSGEKTVFAHFSPIMHGQEYLGVIFIAKDITEMKRLHAELLQNEKLAMIGKMSSAIAHELRNPLVPIGGFARLIHRKAEKESPIKKYADIIIKEIDRLEELLWDFLGFTKEVKPSLQPVNLNDIAKELLSLFRYNFAEKGINIATQLDPGMPQALLDSSQIKQALINILNNAIQAMPEGGTITIETKVEEREGKPVGSISITDTGPGIPEEVRMNIFEPFYTTKIHGLGLGLTVTKGIIDAHGGEIRMESEEGKGTTFIITLPISGS